MREIIFRGKAIRTQRYCSLNKGEWIFGSLKQLKDGRCYIYSERFYGEYQVDKTTVGEYIGIEDKNGMKIFEGDIVSDGFVFKYSNSYCRFQREKDGEYLQISPSCFVNGSKFPYEVIGNIYDE